MSNPTVSIILSSFNQASTLNKSLLSIFQQPFQDYEVIIINDGSIDNTKTLLDNWQPKFTHNKFTVISNKTNIGLTKSLNIGIKKASGKYIARLDADDWWEKDKLNQQVSWLNKNPDYGVLGTFYVNHYKSHIKKITLPNTDEQIRKEIYKQNPFGHSCVLINAQLLKKAGGYDNNIKYGQDRDLWFRLLPLTKFANLDQYLVNRTINSKISRTSKNKQLIQTLKTNHKYIKKYHAPYFNYLYLFEPLLLLLIPNWLKKLLRKNL